MVMESSHYWQSYGELKKRPFVWQMVARSFITGKAGGEVDRDIFVHGDRAMSLEVYLAVPTFIRRGLSITD